MMTTDTPGTDTGTPTDQPTGDVPRDAGSGPTCNSVVFEDLATLGMRMGAVTRYTGNNNMARMSSTAGLQVPAAFRTQCDFSTTYQRVFRYTMQGTATLRVSTSNPGTTAGFDTTLQVLARNICTYQAGLVYACNDDDPTLPMTAANRLTSRLNTGVIMAGQTVTIGAGSVLRCAQGAEFDVQGSLIVNGTGAQPVLFGPATGAVWGGIWIHGAGSQIQATHAFFTGGGADPSWISSHSMHSHKSEEPLITWSDSAAGTIEDCHVMGNPSGQSLHGEDSTFTVRRCLLQRAVSGGQIHNCTLTWEYNHLVEMPIDDSLRWDLMPSGIAISVNEKHESANARRWLASTAILARMRGTSSSWMSGSVCRMFWMACTSSENVMSDGFLLILDFCSIWRKSRTTG